VGDVQDFQHKFASFSAFRKLAHKINQLAAKAELTNSFVVVL